MNVMENMKQETLHYMIRTLFAQTQAIKILAERISRIEAFLNIDAESNKKRSRIND